MNRSSRPAPAGSPAISGGAPLLRQIGRIPCDAGRARRADIVGVAGVVEVEGAAGEQALRQFLLDKVELVAVIGPAIATKDRETLFVVERIGETEARLPAPLNAFRSLPVEI